MNPDLVENEETLGHCVFNSKNACRPPRAGFFEDPLIHGDGLMSVDRLDYADKDILCEVHDEEALKRGSDRSFYGWLTFEAVLLRRIGLEVYPTPSTDPRNLWHADLKIPNFSEDAKDEISQFAEELRAMAKWEEKPLNRQAREDIENASRRIED